MPYMKASEIRARYLKFFASRAHAVIPAAPIIPPDDPTTLFTSSGMQQMVPYLKGAKHPMGKRIVDSQPSFRSDDIEEVGDNRHTCMFEMLGNWSLGDYFKQEQLSWIWEFFTEELGLPAEKLYITLFEGNELVPKDLESYDIWKSLGVKDDHIVYYPGKKNWWSRAGTPDQMPLGEIGGPTSEIFFEFTGVVHDKKFGDICHPNCDCGRFLEIGNSVFMAYEKIEGGLKPLPSQNVDFGGGLERITAAVNDDPDVFNIDIFKQLNEQLTETVDLTINDTRKRRIRKFLDHSRAAAFLISEGILPGKNRQESVLRRLIRRADDQLIILKLSRNWWNISIDHYQRVYSDFVSQNWDTIKIKLIISEELDQYGKINKTTDKLSGLLDTILISNTPLSTASNVAGPIIFNYQSTHGVPAERALGLAESKNFDMDILLNKYAEEMKKHQELSRTASAGMFKGGLADQSEITTKYHTATHLLHQALIDVLGDEIQQAGSNITSERLRFDYAFSGKPTATQLKKISEIINAKISEDLPVVKTIEDKDKAINSGARAFFSEKYPEKVSVYTIGTYSKELCGGPHVESTGVIGKIEIYKDEALGSGKRRIYAKLAKTLS